MPKTRLSLTALALLALVGCTATPKADPEPATVSADRYDAAYQAAKQVLRDRGWTLDRQDHRFGVLTTEPRRAGTLLEPWEGLGQSPAQAAEATIDQLRRSVRVTLEPQGALPADTYALDVAVVVEREVIPTRRVVNTGNRSRVFYPLESVPLEWQRRGIQSDYWRPVTQDHQMEQALLDAIVAQAQSEAQ